MRRVWPDTAGRIKNVLPLEDYVKGELFRAKTPFRSESWVANLFRAGLVILVQIFEKLMGKKLWIEDLYRELHSIKRNTRSLLATLIENSVIGEWEFRVEQSWGQQQYVSSLRLGAIHDSDGRLICEQGSLSGFGSASDPDASLTIALAEALERFSSTKFSSDHFKFASINELRSTSRAHRYVEAIRPLEEVDHDKQIGWCTAKDLYTDTKTLVPANATYLFYRWSRPDEPMFVDVSSSGVAAHTTFHRALTLALYENLERDGFLMYWLNRLSPTRIELSGVEDDFVQETLSQLAKNNFSTYILDCKTEFQIPVLVMVTIDNVNYGVSVHAVAGIDIDAMIRKLCADTLRWDLNYHPPKPAVKWQNIKSLEDREALWYGGYMREHIEFFISGPTVTYAKYKDQFTFPSGDFDELGYMKRQLQVRQTEAYYYEFTNSIARTAGLYVVRAIVPDLMPIYFSEKQKHLNVPRLYSFAQKMGYKDRPIAEEEINNVPHPFI